jgi:hypothetical protein
VPSSRSRAAPCDPDLSRRDLLAGAGFVAVSVALPVLRSGRARADEPFRLPAATLGALEKSPLVYVSPLKSDGSESRCHGEVWYFFDRGDVVLATGKNVWKTRAVKRGLDRARIWVGDYGPAGSADGPFRKGPSFLAKAALDRDPATFERLLESYGRKYPDGWGKWEPRFRKGYAEGSRIVIRYTPVGA